MTQWPHFHTFLDHFTRQNNCNNNVNIHLKANKDEQQELKDSYYYKQSSKPDPNLGIKLNRLNQVLSSSKSKLRMAQLQYNTEFDELQELEDKHKALLTRYVKDLQREEKVAIKEDKEGFEKQEETHNESNIDN
eukprot:CAMPEP_0171311254 /NCGR_PEP_ID=MMETSP0816-20121228/21492_1 /TAXON_ID=420281 /ORGANISM="Proboscia inermis, Strain CCAP1064/1" /LENGTH=133 /DNA_ID=CAMNT_0011795913 /DNA_START=376 /DNA_END=778 /DNA_ORIENTATION=-